MATLLMILNGIVMLLATSNIYHLLDLTSHSLLMGFFNICTITGFLISKLLNVYYAILITLEVLAYIFHLSYLLTYLHFLMLIVLTVLIIINLLKVIEFILVLI